MRSAHAMARSGPAGAMRWLRTLAIASAAAAAVTSLTPGCAASPDVLRRRPEALQRPPASAPWATVIFSATTAQPCLKLPTRLFFHAIGPDGSRGHSDFVWVDSATTVAELRPFHGALHALNLPAGTLRIVPEVGGVPDPRHAEIRLDAGEVVYLGQYFQDHPCERIDGRLALQFSFEDHGRRDLPLFEQRRPDLVRALTRTEIPAVPAP